MRLLRLPGVHRPRSDTWLLAAALAREPLAGGSLLDLCTGTGALAIWAAQRLTRRVTALDVSRRAALTASINAHLNGTRVQVRRGDLFEPLGAERFDAIVSNPPYLPSTTDRLPRHRATTALDAGRDGRALIDRICREAPRHLHPGGRILIVHSSVCRPQQTRRALEREGLESEIVASHRGPLGPLLSARSRLLRERGLLAEGETEEQLVIVRGRLPA